MALLIVNQGLQWLLNQKRASALQGLFLRLYTNDKTPALGDTEADYTEATFGGYAAIELDGWQTPAQVSSGLYRTDEVVRTFTWASSPSNMVYGYYVTNPSGELIWAERHPSAPVLMDSIGDEVAILPRLTEGNAP